MREPPVTGSAAKQAFAQNYKATAADMHIAALGADPPNGSCGRCPAVDLTYQHATVMCVRAANDHHPIWPMLGTSGDANLSRYEEPE